MSRISEFALSRIYAEGWNAAGRLSAGDSALLETGGIAALNPYTEGRARVRWAEGFGHAIGEDNRPSARAAGLPGRGR